MSVTDTIHFDKSSPPAGGWKRFFISITIILVALLSFGIGRLTSVGNSEPIKIEHDTSLTSKTSQTASVVSSLTIPKGSVVASKNGKKYHYPSCPSAKQISEKNKITFASPVAADASGYTLASNCKVQ